MAKRKRTIFNEPDYEQFVLRYYNNFPRFFAENCRNKPTWQQMEVAAAITQPGCRVACASGHGCFGAGTGIRMADGSTKCVEDISIGDEVMGADLKPQKVIELARGEESMYRFTYSNSDSHVVNESHTLLLYDLETRNVSMTVQEWLMDGLNGNTGKYAVEQLVGGFGWFTNIILVEYVGDQDYYGFKLDGDGRFLDKDGYILQNTGKSDLMSWVLTWHLTAFPLSNALLTATNIDQCRSVIWKYLDSTLEDLFKNWPFLSAHVVKETKRLYIRNYKDSWYVIPKTASKAKPENVAGQHNKHYIVVCDEASGIDDVIHGVLQGALTHEWNRYVMMSQPTRATGQFAECWGAEKERWTTFNLNSEESPLVSKNFIEEKLIQYGGHHSPEYQIKVLGRLPDNLSGYLIPKSWLEEAQYVKIEHVDEWGWVVLVDVAEGVSRDSSVWNICKVSGYGDSRKVEAIETKEYLDLDELVFARELYQRVRDLPNVTVAVDADGPGRTVILTLEELGMNCERIHWGLLPHMDSDKKRYKNLRAFASYKAREAVRQGRMKIMKNQKIVDQGSKIPYKLNERGQYEIMSKDQMKSEGIKSPDLFDTYCFPFLIDYIPANDANVADEENDLMKAALALINGD